MHLCAKFEEFGEKRKGKNWKTPNAPSHFQRNASVMDGRDGSPALRSAEREGGPSRPRVFLAVAVASARRPYLSRPAVTNALLFKNLFA
jgi:hypothetical protein